MKKKFTVLRIIATAFKVIAWLVLVAGILGGCLFAASILLMGAGTSARNSGVTGLLGGGLAGSAAGIGVVIGAVFSFLPLYAFGDLIYIFIDMEENTRLTAERLKEILAKG